MHEVEADLAAGGVDVDLEGPQPVARGEGRLGEVPGAVVGVLLQVDRYADATQALLLFGTALQRGSVTTASAVMFVVETVVPAAVGLALLGDRTRPGFAPVAAAGFALTLACAVLLARFADPE